MSQILNEPWLSRLFAREVRLDVDNNKDGRRLQLFRFVRAPEDDPEGAARAERERYPVTCEVSDKHHFMRAAMTRRAIRGFEARQGMPIETMGGMVVQVLTFRLMLYADAPAQRPPPPPRERQRARRNRPAAGPLCPKRIRDTGCPQFWMMITKFAYLGAEGNNVFDEPHYILTDPAVRDAMAALTGVRRRGEDVEDEPEEPEAPREQLDPDEKDDDPLPPKRQRLELDSPSPPTFSPIALAATQFGPLLLGTPAAQSSAASSAQGPTVEQVPFAADPQAVWACAALWQAVGIQRACIPHMPVHGAAGAPRRPAAARGSADPGTPEPVRARALSLSPAHSGGGTPSPLRAGGAGGAAAAAAAAADSLRALLEPGDAELLSAGAMMENMYGSIRCCVSEPGSEYDVAATGGEGIDAARLLLD
ncbi:hypothetical protein H4R18_000919 [Coemansia javaensis]|uniref:Uncharacterized protein n=1 Tax=Coemansia javaensis TaxID=2761396 RepID=A0A9W8LM45_9FUNG|nr:hypothetical protein H4R18_000919 [Coemansia javaensis]